MLLCPVRGIYGFPLEIHNKTSIPHPTKKDTKFVQITIGYMPMVIWADNKKERPERVFLFYGLCLFYI